MTAVALILVAALAQPAGDKPVVPVRVDADQVHYAFQKREVVFTGAPVTLTRDDARLTCRRLVARTGPAGQVQIATCEGDVRLVRGERVLTCQRAVFDAARDTVTCEGDPVLRERGTEGRGTRLVYDLGADEVRFEGEPGKPVRVLVPGDELEQRRKELEQRRKEGRK